MDPLILSVTCRWRQKWVWWLNGCLKREFWKRTKNVTEGWMKGRKNKATVTDIWAYRGDFNIIIRCSSDGNQKTPVKRADLICVIFTDTLRCVSLSVCLLTQYGSSCHHHLIFKSLHYLPSFPPSLLPLVVMKRNSNSKKQTTCVHDIYLIKLLTELTAASTMNVTLWSTQLCTISISVNATVVFLTCVLASICISIINFKNPYI